MSTQLSRLQALSPTTQASLALAAGVSTIAIYRIHKRYTEWLTVGRGGLPYNFLGYLINEILWLVQPPFDMLETSVYDDPKVLEPYGPDAKRSLLNPLPTRTGTREPIHPAIAPQRQLTPNPQVLRTTSLKIMTDLVASNPTKLEIATSKAEKHGPAIFLLDLSAAPKWATATRGEIGHFHLDSEGSAHCVLLPQDAREVISKGWGQRHALSGGRMLMVGYCLIYAPRDEEELEIVKRIMTAGVDAMCGTS